jgi:hypothetical protein
MTRIRAASLQIFLNFNYLYFIRLMESLSLRSVRAFVAKKIIGAVV